MAAGLRRLRPPAAELGRQLREEAFEREVLLERSRLLIRDIIRGGVHRPSIYFARVTSTSRTASDP